jgi:hypothetical protein
VRLVLGGFVVAALVGCGGHAENGATTTRTQPAATGIRVSLTADSHRPRVGKPWHYEVRVTDMSGRPVAATVHLQILFGGTPVGQVGRHRVVNGVWSETIGTEGNAPFPARSRGVPLVFEAVVKARGETKRVRYPISVK